MGMTQVLELLFIPGPRLPQFFHFLINQLSVELRQLLLQPFEATFCFHTRCHIEHMYLCWSKSYSFHIFVIFPLQKYYISHEPPNFPQDNSLSHTEGTLFISHGNHRNFFLNNELHGFHEL